MRHVDISATIQVYRATEKAYKRSRYHWDFSFCQAQQMEVLWKGRVWKAPLSVASPEHAWGNGSSGWKAASGSHSAFTITRGICPPFSVSSRCAVLFCPNSSPRLKQAEKGAALQSSEVSFIFGVFEEPLESKEKVWRKENIWASIKLRLR